MLTEPLAVVCQVVDVLDDLGVPYAIGSSLASAVHGVMRATMDADLVADMRPEHAAPLVHALGSAFYADLEAIQAAIHHRASFNLIHLETMFKVDMFVAKSRPFERSQLARRGLETVSSDPERRLYIISAEDVVLAKLDWYRLGGGTSDRQWRDILGVLSVQGERLDRDYLQRMAKELKVSNLLQRAYQETGTAKR